MSLLVKIYIFVVSRRDYCHSLLSSSRNDSLSSFQVIQNAAERLLTDFFIMVFYFKLIQLYFTIKPVENITFKWVRTTSL